MRQLVPIDVTPEPGQLISLKVGDQKVALANVDGTLFAFEDECTHEDCPLSQGYLDGDIVICDCHGGMFDVRTGEPVGGPVHVAIRTFSVIRVGTNINLDIGND